MCSSDLLSLLAEPDVALITNIGVAHLEGFGSIDDIAQAKSEVFRGLKKDGIALLNRDDEYYEYLSEQANDYRQISFGSSEYADVRLQKDSLTSSLDENAWKTYFDVATAQGDMSIQLSLAGRHNVQNALAAIAVAVALEIPLADIISGLALMSPVSGRMQVRKGIGEWSDRKSVV